MPEAGSAEIIGYYTLTMSEVASAIVPQKGLPSAQPIPVALLGRLAVALSAQGQGIGERLLFAALSNALQASSRIGCFAVVVDAINDNAARFYSRYGFRILSDDVLHLFLTLKDIRKMELKLALLGGPSA